MMAWLFPCFFPFDLIEEEKLMVRPSNSVSKRYLFFSPVFQNVWAAIQEIFICIFDDENEQYFAVNNIISGSVTIHFHIAFRHQFPVIFDPHL